METQKNLLQVVGDWWATRRIQTTIKQSHIMHLPRVLRWLMPNGGTLLMVLALVLTQSLWARPFQATTHAPGSSATTVNYQGRLADNVGAPLDGTYGMSFSLWDAATGGSVVWGPEEHLAVPVSEGLFSVGLGSQSAGGIPTNTWNGDRYLEIAIGGETLSPRELIRSVPIAGMALTVPDGAIGAAQIATDAVGSDEIAEDAVGSSELAAGAVGATELGDGAAISRKVRLAHGQKVGSAGEFTLNGTSQTLPGLSLSLSPVTDQVLMLTVTLDAIKDSGSGNIVAQVYVDGNVFGRAIVLGSSVNSVRTSIAGAYSIDLTAGAHTIEVRAFIDNGTGGRITTENSTMTYFLIGQ